MYFIGVDVGTASVRAALFSSIGELIGSHVEPISVFNPLPDFYEQSSDEMWEKVCTCVRASVQALEISKRSQIRGIGFDATCSIVFLDEAKSPLCASPSGENKHNVIMWMDHRANKETEFVNSTNHAVLKRVGGKISVEMQIPKLMWMKKNMPVSWSVLEYAFDLPDFLSFKATGIHATRSVCSAVCKWTWDAEKGFAKDFLKLVDLEDLIYRINRDSSGDLNFVYPGSFIGTLSQEAAESMNLSSDVVVGASIIDAYAGALASIDLNKCTIDNTLCLIAGTSSCHIINSKEELFVPGVWGPYNSVLFPGYYSCEGGQSVAGKLIDFIITTHPAYNDAKMEADIHGKSIYDHLNAIIYKLTESQRLNDPCYLTIDLHMTADYHGNRSPLADANVKGFNVGLSMDTSMNDLAMKYCACILAIAYGTRDIIEAMREKGYKINVMSMSGGLVKNDLFVKFHSDVTGLPVLLPSTIEHSVVLGSAVLGSTAYKSSRSGLDKSLSESLRLMVKSASEVDPNGETKLFHDAKFKVYKLMQQNGYEYRAIMRGHQ